VQIEVQRDVCGVLAAMALQDTALEHGEYLLFLGIIGVGSQ
jgi:hypothetical protein